MAKLTTEERHAREKAVLAQWEPIREAGEKQMRAQRVQAQEERRADTAEGQAKGRGEAVRM